MKNKKMHRTQLFISSATHEALQHETQALGVSISELVRQIISQYLNTKTRKTTESGMKILLDMVEEKK